MAETDEDRCTEAGPSGASAGEWTVRTLARVTVAAVGVVVGLVWTARIALADPASPAVLLRLLPPLALIYLGVYFARSAIDADRQ